MAEIGIWFIIEIIVFLLITGILLPLAPFQKIRYYGCYICIVFAVSSVGYLILPILILRPRNIDNLRLSAGILKHFTKIIGIKWELKNGHILEKNEAAIVTANHQSVLDVLGLFNIWDALKHCTGVAKKELLFFPNLGPIAWLSGIVFINRSNHKGAITELNSSASTLLKNKAKFWFFPEGTRNKKGGDLLPFKKGAFRIAIQHQVPIIPVVYSPYYFIDSKNKRFDKGKITISVLESIPTEGMTLDDIDTLIEKTQRVMSKEWEQLRQEVPNSRQTG